MYVERLPKQLRATEQIIGFRYPLPVGLVRLLVRANHGSDSFVFGEVFEHEYYRVPLQSPPRTILDLGANAGFSSVYFARQYPNACIVCVEPVPSNVRVLVRNLELNGVNAVVIPAAVDVNDGRVMIELGTMDYGHKISSSPANDKTTLEVEAVSIPTIVRRLGWNRIGLLKMDIEGHERSLFSEQCDWLRLVDNMCIECHNGFTERDLRMLAERYFFRPPRALPGIWFMSR
jgi:FkbM family methyltransferase